MASQKSSGNRSVVLVGRPNVGKSTLFNRLTGTRRAIVAPIAGTTRDIIAADAEWQGAHVTVVDTGGMFGASTDPLHELVLIARRLAEPHHLVAAQQVETLQPVHNILVIVRDGYAHGWH